MSASAGATPASRIACRSMPPPGLSHSSCRSASACVSRPCGAMYERTDSSAGCTPSSEASLAIIVPSKRAACPGPKLGSACPGRGCVSSSPTLLSSTSRGPSGRSRPGEGPMPSQLKASYVSTHSSTDASTIAPASAPALPCASAGSAEPSEGARRSARKKATLSDRNESFLDMQSCPFRRWHAASVASAKSLAASGVLSTPSGSTISRRMPRSRTQELACSARPCWRAAMSAIRLGKSRIGAWLHSARRARSCSSVRRAPSPPSTATAAASADSPLIRSSLRPERVPMATSAGRSASQCSPHSCATRIE
mmetsp:Transcript_247/g.899  ORF Transcript_247/g.899 Transcript_247/m.899 type:complete len:310 (-) Transcript_247:943-1872(-)